MTRGNAKLVFDNINSDEYSDGVKAIAIYEILNMETHKSVTKNSMLKVIRWLWDRQFELKSVDDKESE